MKRMLYGPLAVVAASPRAGPSEADAQPLANMRVAEVAAGAPAPLVVRTFLRLVPMSDWFALVIPDPPSFLFRGSGDPSAGWAISPASRRGCRHGRRSCTLACRALGPRVARASASATRRIS